MLSVPQNNNGQANSNNSQPVVIASDQTAIPVIMSGSTLPSDASTATLQTTINDNLTAINVDLGNTNDVVATDDSGTWSLIALVKRLLGKFNVKNTVPTGTDNSLLVKLTPQTIFRTTFSKVLANNVDTDAFTLIRTGAGQTVNQTAGNLVITAGTTANSEVIIRSNNSFMGSFLLKEVTALSQRIINNNFFIELVDVIGDGLVITVNSATSITVTIPNNPFTSVNVGQSMFIGNFNGFTGVTAIPNRYAIASVSGNNVNFTVAGFVLGSVNTGTCSVFGWNYHQLLYTSTVVTNVSYDTQRNGWNNGYTVAIINTTAGVGHMGIMASEDGNAFLADQLIASSATLPVTVRASRVTNLATENIPLFLQIRSINGSTAPASSTTWTIGGLSVENYATQPVALTTAKVQGANSAQPVTLLNTPAVTVNSGTVTTVTTVGTVTNVTNPVNVNIPVVAADVASAAITSTATTSAITPALGRSFEINIPVTAVSGTNPTIDVVVQESDDTGTNWFDVYHFQRITATGIYRSPKLPLTGNRIRYVQTVGGTTPSFTRAINRLQSSDNANLFRCLYDRSISLTTLNATSAVLYCGGCGNVQLTVSLGSTTTAPVMTIQGSEDNVNWYSLGSNLTTVGSSTTQLTLNNISPQFVRVLVQTAGSLVTLNYLQLKAFK
jgi:hypothetical protein